MSDFFPLHLDDKSKPITNYTPVQLDNIYLFDHFKLLKKNQSNLLSDLTIND